jgi:hypothetical protein
MLCLCAEDFAQAIAPMIRDYCDGVDIRVAATTKRFSKYEYEGKPNTEKQSGDMV